MGDTTDQLSMVNGCVGEDSDRQKLEMSRNGKNAAQTRSSGTRVGIGGQHIDVDLVKILDRPHTLVARF